MAILPRHRLAELEHPALDRVVCAVDGSRGSAAAIREALAIAPCAARLSFIAVTDVAEAGGDRVASLAAHRARQTLEQAQALACARALPADTVHVQAPNVVDALVARAGTTAVLVVGSRGDAGRAPAPTGDLATALAARTTGPLLIARAGAGAHGTRPRILVAVDDGDEAAELVALAGAVASGCHGYVHLVHVRGRGYGSHTRHRLAELSTALIEQTGSEPVVEVARAANVAAHVCQLAQDSESSLLVVGRREQARRRSLGPAGDGIVHGSSCSVLVVPTHAA